MKRKFRLTENYQFQNLKRRGQKLSGRFFLLGWLPNTLGYSRFGFVAPKKVAKAVKRNRAVRLLRESIRLRLDEIKPGFDIVLVTRGGILEKKFTEVDQEMERVLRKAGLIN